MQPRITLITLGVDDLERALNFYRDGLGLKTDGIVGTEFEHGAVAFFELEGGLRLVLWPRKSLSHDCGLPVSAPSPTDLCLAVAAASLKPVHVHRVPPLHWVTAVITLRPLFRL